MIYSRAVRPLLFLQDAETAHERTIALLATACVPLPRVAPLTHRKLQVCVAGMDFPNPVGLAAGCDKNARAVTAWPRFGFGFVEVGTITAQAQPGNPKPRLFRLKQMEAIVNRMGFNGDGSEQAARRLARLRRGAALRAPLGVNIGKTKAVSGDDATLDDYRASYRRLAPFADYIAVNVSSPNTPGLRLWQEKGRLEMLLAALMEETRLLALARGRAAVPLFVKISPDMNDEDMGDVAEIAARLELSGIIATNTTIARQGETSAVAEEGGLSGKPLKTRANEVMRFLYRETGGKLPLIGVGGIASAEDAYERIRSGASLVQIYTALVFEGPFLPRTINRGLLRLMERDGVKSISEVVGQS